MYKKLIVAAVCATLALPAMATIATFDWNGTPSNWSGTPILDNDNEGNGYVTTTTGRIFNAGGHELIQTPAIGAAYGNQVQIGTIALQSGSQFDVQTFTVGLTGVAGFSPNPWGTIEGKLGGATVWTVSYAGGAGQVMTLDDTAAPLAGQIIDSMTWSTDTGSWGNTFDNLVIDVVPEPATIGLLGLAGAALYVRRKLS